MALMLTSFWLTSIFRLFAFSYFLANNLYSTKTFYFYIFHTCRPHRQIGTATEPIYFVKLIPPKTLLTSHQICLFQQIFEHMWNAGKKAEKCLMWEIICVEKYVDLLWFPITHM